MNVSDAMLWLVKWIAAFAIAQWASLDVRMQTLVWLMVIDYASGLAGAAIRRELSSAAGLRGLVKKSATFLLILAIHVAQRDLGWQGLNLGPMLAIGYSANELISIVENCAKVGVPIPERLLSLLLSVKRLRPNVVTPEQIEELES